MIVPDEETGAEQVAYEPPAIERLGTLGELTQGVGPANSDGLFSGSFFT